jgi:hypothetical protein
MSLKFGFVDARLLTSIPAFVIDYKARNGNWVFWTLSIPRYSETCEQRFGNWICFRPQVRGEAYTQVGPLERANRSHWTTHASITIAI